MFTYIFSWLQWHACFERCDVHISLVPPGRMDLTDAIVKGEVDTEEPEPSVTNPSPATLESLIGSVAATVQLSPRAHNSFFWFCSLELFPLHGFVLASMGIWPIGMVSHFSDAISAMCSGFGFGCDTQLWRIVPTCARSGNSSVGV